MWAQSRSHPSFVLRTSSLVLRYAITLPLMLALCGCLERVPVAAPVGSAAVATVPPPFFAATPVASCCLAATSPPTPPGGRYTLGPIERLTPEDRRAAYATPLLAQGTKFVQVTLRINELPTPRTPAVSYELVTEAGVFGALADGEWAAAVAEGRGYRQEGVVLFVVPEDVRTGRLDIVDYYYLRGAANTPTTSVLVRRVGTTFSIDHLP